MKKEEENQKRFDKILPANITEEMKRSFIEYSMYVIKDRALPDVRDGFKPVLRRILYSMNEIGLSNSARFRKSAAVVGDVIAKYHPHGDTSVYDAMAKMVQTWTYRYPLVAGQGNFGSIDGDPPAAYRYTEAKMSKISGELLRDLEKDTVDFQSNFDDSRTEPKVFPSVVPNLLLNGTLGIAVGMATNIPPHNLREVVDATISLIKNPKATTEDLLEFVKGPDFPIGGIIYNEKDIHQAYATGRGGVTTRGEAEIIEDKKGNSQILIYSLPFRVNKASLILKIAELVTAKKIIGIKALRDESTKDIRVVIDLKGTAHPQKVLNFIYKHTDLEQNFNFNIVALVDGVPQTLGLKDILSNFILHRQEVVRRRTEFELRKAEARAHILESLKKALDNIDAVIKTIKVSKDAQTAKLNLIKKFKFSEIQAQAILDMKLQKLAGLERKKIEDELKEIKKTIVYLKDLLSSKKKMLNIIKVELAEIREKYGDDRRTRVVKGGVKEINTEDLIPQKSSALVFTAGGYIKRTDPTEFKAQKRGGVGVIDINTKEEDVVTHFLTTDTHSNLLFFSDLGKVYQIKMYDIPEGKRSTKGKSIRNFLPLSGEENITSILAVPKETEMKNKSFLFITKLGLIKRTSADAFKTVRANGLIAIKLRDKDELFSVRIVDEDSSSVLGTKNGQSIRFKCSDARIMGRATAGVKGISLKKDDEVVGTGIIKKVDEKKVTIFIMTENGYGKRTNSDEYKIQTRGGSGIKVANITDKTGKLVSVKVVTEETHEIIAISEKSQVIRTSIDSIPILGRATQGVKIMRLRAGDKLASLSLL